MSTRKLVIGLAVLIIVAAGWYAFRPERLFINQTVNEQFPTASAASAQTVALVSGQFHSGAHETKGDATIYQLPGGKKTLRLTEFQTSNGPDVQVYLVAASDATDNETVTRAGFLPLGALKGNIGDQNYDLPADVDLNKYRAVTIWCRRFGVNFGTAPLARKQS
ncbi:MAG TPA: DM13 domain-containing protein [Pyrinomonadaceae bacterium]|nr:DM13 domain-containing protein [Pyrinomonadaceae bacterium]